MRKIAIIFSVLLTMIMVNRFKSFGENENFAHEVKKYTVKIVRELPHSIDSFTQGLIFYEEKIYESTGLIGNSSLRRIDSQTGTVEKIVSVPGVFAEGLARWESRLVQLTWNERIAFIYNMFDFSKVGTFSYETQGWGLTADDHHLIMSDGSDRICFRNPNTFKEERAIFVRYEGKPINYINELEYVDGLIYANIWNKKFIVQIDPLNGNVLGHIDCKALLHRLPPLNSEDVLNGIAYNDKKKTFYLTGKNWPKIFEVTLVPQFPNS